MKRRRIIAGVGPSARHYLSPGLCSRPTMEVLGHASPDVTMGIYGHLQSASRRQAAELMDGYLDELERPPDGLTR